MSDAFNRLNDIPNSSIEKVISDVTGDPQGQHPKAEYWYGSSLPKGNDQLDISGDPTIDILDICVEDIDLNQIPYDKNTVEVYEEAYPQDLPRTRKNDMELSWNSTWTMEFSSPVYIWLLENI